MIGTTRSMSVIAAISAPRLLHLVDVGHVSHGASCVQIRQDHPLVVRGQDIGSLGHEVDAAEDDGVGLVVIGGPLGELERVAPQVGPPDDLGPLVVVAEDQESFAEGALRGLDPRRQLVGRRERVPVRQGSLESQHGVAPHGWYPLCEPGDGRRGQPGRPPRGCRPRARIVIGNYQARSPMIITSKRQDGFPAERHPAAVWRRGSRADPGGRLGRCSVPKPARSRRPPARTSSRTSAAGSSTSARRRTCAAACPTTSAHRSPSSRAPARWSRSPTRSSGSRSATRSRRSSSSTTSSRRITPGSTSGTRTTSRTRTWRSPLTRSGPARWSCGARSARACATSGPTRTPTRSGRRSTSSSARSRSAPARTRSSTATSASGARASTPTSRSARRRAWATSARTSTTGSSPT